MLRRCTARAHGHQPQGAAMMKGKATPYGPQFGFEPLEKPVHDLGPGDFSHGVFDPQWVSPFVRLAESSAKVFKSTGYWLCKVTDKLMSSYPKEDLYRLRRIVAYGGQRPDVKDNCFIAPNAVVIGDVVVGRKSTIGYNAVVRGDHGPVRLGESSCINDKVVIHGPCNIGKWTTIDPMSVVEQADVASCSMVGAASVVMPGARIESGSMLCAASVLRSGAVVPSGEIWSGNPAERLGYLTEQERGYIVKAAKHMVLLNLEHTATWEMTYEDMENYRLSREVWAVWAENSYEMRAKPFYTRAGPKDTGRFARSPLELIEGRLTFHKEKDHLEGTGSSQQYF